MPKLLLAAYATGIGLAYFFTSWEATGLCVTTAILLLLWLLLRNTSAALAPFLGMLCLAGFINTHQQLIPATDVNQIIHLANKSHVLIEGIVDTVEQRAVGGYKVLTKARHISNQPAQKLAVSCKILLYIDKGEFTARPGQIIRWRSRLRKPSHFGNPGEFDYPGYLASKNIYLTAFVKDADDVVSILNHPDNRPSIVENLRLDLGKRINEAVSTDQTALTQSLLLGLRSGISPAQRQTLADSGIAHLFAISGLHFGLLALFFYRTGKYLYCRSQRLMLWLPPQKIIPLLLIAPLAAYLLLTGNAWATRRAFLMVSVIAALFVCNRRVTGFNLLALVAIVLLLCNPLALFQPGFQLSFAGVAGILAWMPSMQQRLTDTPMVLRWVLLIFLTTLSATIATTPVLLWHFHKFSPAGLITNLVAIPLIAWGAVPFGLSGLAILPLSVNLADLFLRLSAHLVSLTLELAKVISKWPLFEATQTYITTSELIIMSGTLLILLPLKNIRHHWWLRLTIMLLVAATATFIAPHNATFRVTALSVGQGDATLISTSGDKHFLIDGGGLPRSSIDPGKDLIAPALGRMGISALDGVIVTHSHPDHSYGLAFIINHFPVKQFYYASDLHDLPYELQKALDERKISTVQLPEGWTEIFNERGELISLFVPDQASRNINERSIIAYASNSNNGVLLPADAGGPALQQLMNADLPGEVSLLKLPHHGSRYAKPESFLKWLKPDISFVSAGLDNSYGFPHDQTVKACAKYQTYLYRTDRDGMLQFHQIDDGWHVTSCFQ